MVPNGILKFRSLLGLALNEGTSKRWMSAIEHCAGIYSNLVAINSPTEQQELFTLSWIDLTAQGLKQTYA